MARMEPAKCGCEWPCSCFKYKGKEYGGTAELIDELEKQIEHHKDRADHFKRAAFGRMYRTPAYDERKFN